MTESDIIKMIDDATRSSGLAAATICERATGNSRLYTRLKAGGSVRLPTVRKLTAFIEALEVGGGAA